jgi:hypothetical protein
MLKVTDEQFNAVGEFLLLAGKHTWGKGCGGGSRPYAWTNVQFEALRRSENVTDDASFASCERAWAEQRMQLAAAATAAAGTPLGHTLTTEVAKLTPTTPTVDGMVHVPKDKWGDGLTLAGGIKLGFDVSTGAITTLTDSATGKEHATHNNSLAEVWYKTGSLAEEKSYVLNYSVTIPDPWGGPGLGVRAGMNQSSVSKRWNPTLAGIWYQQHPAADGISDGGGGADDDDGGGGGGGGGGDGGDDGWGGGGGGGDANNAGSSAGIVVVKLSMPTVAATQYGAPPVLWLVIRPGTTVQCSFVVRQFYIFLEAFGSHGCVCWYFDMPAYV